ncbi:MAG: hypothetical protein ACPHID_07225 [Thermoplasmatota archaeon]
MAPEPTLLRDHLDVVLPSGEQYRIRPGPYGKGIAVAALATGTPRTKTEATGRRGRKPRASTLALRERLERDAGKGKLQDNRQYVKWLMGRDDTISLAVARQVVYRERRKHV